MKFRKRVFFGGHYDVEVEAETLKEAIPLLQTETGLERVYEVTGVYDTVYVCDTTGEEMAYASYAPLTAPRRPHEKT